MQQFKTLTCQDLPKILVIEQSAERFPWSSQMLLDSLQAGVMAQGLLVNDQLVAYCLVSVVLPEAEILNICVHKDQQGQGYGKSLLQHVMASLKAQGVSTVFLEVRVSNQTAINLYQLTGFKLVGVRKDYYVANHHTREDALVFSCSI